jgi:hypothetical protein
MEHQWGRVMAMPMSAWAGPIDRSSDPNPLEPIGERMKLTVASILKRDGRLVASPIVGLSASTCRGSTAAATHSRG